MELEGTLELVYTSSKIIAFNESIPHGSDTLRLCISFRRGSGAIEALWTIWPDSPKLLSYSIAPAFHESKKIAPSLGEQQRHRRVPIIHCHGGDDIVVRLKRQPAMVRRTRKRRNETTLSDISVVRQMTICNRTEMCVLSVLFERAPLVSDEHQLPGIHLAAPMIRTTRRLPCVHTET